MSIHEYAASMFSYLARFGLVGVHTFASSLVLWSMRHTSIGWARGPVALALTATNLIPPLLFHQNKEIVTQFYCVCVVTWIASYKIIGWALGRGPLTEKLTFPQFVVTLGMPITPVLTKFKQEQKKSNARQGEEGETIAQSALKIVLKTAGVAFFSYILQSSTIHRLVKELSIMFFCYCFVGLIMQVVGFFTVLLLNMRVAPHFDKPFLSTSLADFWSRRWNLNTGYTLRFLIYDPIVEGSLTALPPPPPSAAAAGRPSQARRFAGTCAAFLASGVMHEAIIVYLRGRVSFYWLAFFTLQGPLVCAEAAARGWIRRQPPGGWVARAAAGVPRPVAVALAVGGLLGVADLLFFVDFYRMGIPQQIVQNVRDMMVPPSLVVAAA